MDELKRCPFCGGEEIITDVDKDNSVPQFAVSTVSVRCKKCGAKISSPPMRSQVEAQKMIYAAWNRRSDGWISDRLPTEDDANEFGEVLTYWDKETRFDSWHNIRKYQSWMPLPQPPKGE